MAFDLPCNSCKGWVHGIYNISAYLTGSETLCDAARATLFVTVRLEAECALLLACL